YPPISPLLPYTTLFRSVQVYIQDYRLAGTCALGRNIEYAHLQFGIILFGYTSFRFHYGHGVESYRQRSQIWYVAPYHQYHDCDFWSHANCYPVGHWYGRVYIGVCWSTY